MTDRQTPEENSSGESARRILARGFAALASGEALSRALDFGIHIYLARVLAPAAFGIVASASAVLVYFSTLSRAGTDPVAMRDIAAGSNPRAIYGHILALRSACAIIAFLVFQVIIAIAPIDPELGQVLRRYGWLIPVLALNSAWFFLGSSRPGVAALGQTLGRLVLLAGVLVSVRNKEDILSYVDCLIAAECAAAIFLAALFFNQYGLRLGPLKTARLRQLLASGWPIALAQLARTITYNSSLLTLGVFCSPAVVGIYAAAQRVTLPLISLGMIYFNIYLPVLSRRIPRGHGPVRYLVVRSALLTGICSTAAAALLSLAAPWLFPRLFGDAYFSAVAPFRVMIWTVPFVVIAGNYRNLLIASHRTREDLRNVGIAACVLLGLNYGLIPRWGAVGAAGAIAASEALLLAISFWSSRSPLAVAASTTDMAEITEEMDREAPPGESLFS